MTAFLHTNRNSLFFTIHSFGVTYSKALTASLNKQVREKAVNHSFETGNKPTYRNILIRSNKMQQYAGFYLLQNYSTCFGCPSHPSSGIHKNVTATSGTGHSIWATTTTFLQRGLWPRWRNVVAQILWPVPEAAVTVWCTPDDGCDRHPKHVE